LGAHFHEKKGTETVLKLAWHVTASLSRVLEYLGRVEEDDKVAVVSIDLKTAKMVERQGSANGKQSRALSLNYFK